MGWYDIYTKEILFDSNEKEVVRRSGVYGGPFMLEVMVRENLLKEAGLTGTDVSKYSIKYLTGNCTTWEQVEAEDAHILDPHQYFNIGDLVEVQIWTNTYHHCIVQKIERWNVTVLTDKGQTITDDYTLVQKEK